jgi:hypothetical protein
MLVRRMKLLTFFVRRMKLICLFVLDLDVNECELSDTCFGNCTNLPGTFLCQCPTGTVGDPSIRNGCIPPHDLDTGNNYLTHTKPTIYRINKFYFVSLSKIHL